MTYAPTQPPGNLDADGLRKWLVEELQRIARSVADDFGVTASAATVAALQALVTTAQSDIVNLQSDIVDLQNADIALALVDAGLQSITNNLTSAWTTFTPTVTPSAGSFTSVSATGRFKQVGKTVHFQSNILITTVGTASGNINMTMPAGLVPNGDFAFPVTEIATVGTMGYARLAGGNSLLINRYDNASFIGANNRLICSGTYEVT